MIEITADTNNFSTLTPQMIAKEVISRGWRMEQLSKGSKCYQLTRLDGKRIQISGSTPPTTSDAAHLLAQDKFVFYSFFENKDFPMPLTIKVNSVVMGVRLSQDALAGCKLVVKPLDRSHGLGVTTGIGTEAALISALQRALRLSPQVIIQKHIDGAVDTRILVIDGAVSAALCRVPAYVTGDGRSTVDSLIDVENNSEHRGDAYSRPLSKIKHSAVRPFLGDRLNEVPGIGEVVQVVGVANMGAGGETIDITDDLPQWLQKMAVDISKALTLGVVGVDILLNAMPKRSSTRDELDPQLLEVNVSPALFIHEIPTHGKSQHAIRDYVDYLSSI